MNKEGELSGRECTNFNSKNGRCRIPHFYGCIKYTGCNCDDIDDCYYKQLQRMKEKLEDVTNELESIYATDNY